MAFDITQKWADGCSLSVKVAELTTREPHSREVEAVAIVANALGQANLVYGVNFVLKTVGENVVLDFSDELAKALGERVLAILGL